MLELGPGADILRTLGWLYIGLIVVLVGASLWFPKRWWQKVVGVAVVLLVFTGPAYLRNRERAQIVDEHTYVFGRGDGQDIIQPAAGTNAGESNVLQFGSGITAADIELVRAGSAIWCFSCAAALTGS